MPSDSVLLFEEIDVQRRSVVLSGSTAPMGGPRRDPAFELGGNLRSTKGFDPGVRAPVRHITGTSEKDIDVHGHLRDSLMGAEGAAKRLRQLIDQIRLDGRMLRILWHNELRRGYLVEATFGVESARDYTYKLKFEVDDQGTSFRNVVRARATLPMGFGDLELDAHRAALVKVPGISIDFGNAITDLWGALSRPLFDMLGAMEDVERAVGDVSDALKGVVTSARAFLDRLEHLAGYLDSMEDPTENDDAAELAAWQRARVDALIALQEAAGRAYDLGAGAERDLLGGSPTRTYVTSDGDTMEAIAAREGVAVEALRKLNPQVPIVPAAGTTLKLP